MWGAIRKSLQGVSAVYNRTQRSRKGDVEGVVRSVLDYVQKRSQGLESRLREELAATNLVDYPNLKCYISDLVRGLTPEYNGIQGVHSHLPGPFQ